MRQNFWLEQCSYFSAVSFLGVLQLVQLAHANSRKTDLENTLPSTNCEYACLFIFEKASLICQLCIKYVVDNPKFVSPIKSFISDAVNSWDVRSIVTLFRDLVYNQKLCLWLSCKFIRKAVVTLATQTAQLVPLYMSWSSSSATTTYKYK
jgi:hypothetical protein